MRRSALLVGVASALLLFTTATGGFSAVSVERSMTVAVATDSEAMVGVQVETTCEGGNTTLVVVLTDRLRDTPLDEATVEAGDAEATVPFTSTTATAELENVTADRVNVTVNGDGVSVALTRAVPAPDGACSDESPGGLLKQESENGDGTEATEPETTDGTPGTETETETETEVGGTATETPETESETETDDGDD